MRYQLWHYVNGMPYAVKGKIVDVPSRPAAIRASRAQYGVASGGASALDIDCEFCEDRSVGNAARWTDPEARGHAACPRCGKTPSPTTESELSHELRQHQQAHPRHETQGGAQVPHGPDPSPRVESSYPMTSNPFTVCFDDGALTPLPGSYLRMATARRHASQAARETGALMAVCLHGTPKLMAHPDGSFSAPEGMAADPRRNCTRGQVDRPCFCEQCRADRRAASCA